MHFHSAFRPIGSLRWKFARYYDSRRRIEDVDQLQSCADGATSAEEHPEIAVLRAADRGLPARNREALLLQIVSGYSVAQIAEQLNVAEAAVRTCFVRTRHELRAQCDEDISGDPME